MDKIEQRHRDIANVYLEKGFTLKKAMLDIFALSPEVKTEIKFLKEFPSIFSIVECERNLSDRYQNKCLNRLNQKNKLIKPQ